MDFLIAESKERNATIVYCASPLSYLFLKSMRCRDLRLTVESSYPPGTHIFDGLDIFPTSVLHMQLGSIPQEPIAWPRPAGEDQEGQNGSRLLGLALGWLKEDRVLRKKAEQAKGRVRGPRPEVRLSC